MISAWLRVVLVVLTVTEQHRAVRTKLRILKEFLSRVVRLRLEMGSRFGASGRGEIFATSLFVPLCKLAGIAGCSFILYD